MTLENQDHDQDQASTPYKKVRTNDPQLKVTGQFRSGPNSDVITFSISLALFEIVCIVTVPPEGERTAPVYIKFKTRRSPGGPFVDTRFEPRD